MAVTRTGPSKAAEPKTYRSPRRVPKIAPVPTPEYDAAAHQKTQRRTKKRLCRWPTESGSNGQIGGARRKTTG